ncbi:hypothetical protein ACFWPA_06300 [Rhodococcus sp. NPDC058505]|uniref:hypothetical protein n=1 Tax=Rhodococcus sp. NPDC058505 TaxID=3346531 RepID=UPI003647C26B
MSLRRVTGIAAATLAAAGLAVAGAGTASAETEVPMTRCLGLSPYIVDQPYAPARLFLTQSLPNEGSGKGTLRLHDVASLWFFAGGYQSDVRLDWRNVDNGKTGTLTDTATVGTPGGDSAKFFLDAGPGKYDLTMSAYNKHALWGMPTTSCTGSVTLN